MVDLVKRIEEEKKATPAQVALAWILTQKPWIVADSGNDEVAAARREPRGTERQSRSR